MNKSSRRNRGATPGSVCTLRRQMLGDQGADALGSSCHDGGFTLKPVHVILLRCEDCLCAPTFRGKSRQGRKADTARDRGLSALPSSAPTGVDRPLPFFTSFPFIPRFCLDLITLELCSGTPSALHCFTDGRMSANTKRRYYTERHGNLPCQLRLIPGAGCKPLGK
jgi:hypothetical protein